MKSESESEKDIDIELLLKAIYSSYHYDFRSYSRASLSRRLSHACTQFNCRSVAALQDRILREPESFSSLLDYLTVQFSDMFRDPSHFRALRQQVLPILGTYPSLKVWVAGCSTGEEAYSLAILFREEGLLERTTIYATDINPQALRKAEAGIYRIDRMAGFSKSYLQTGPRASLSDYYTAAYGAAVLDKTLRNNMVFADHSLATDQVFSEIHLVSCRNVLIYFNIELQTRALRLFDEALCHRGFLCLGAKESLRTSEVADHFELFVKEDRILRKK